MTVKAFGLRGTEAACVATDMCTVRVRASRHDVLLPWKSINGGYIYSI